MNGAAVRTSANQASEAQILDHLARCDVEFDPPLSARVDLHHYAGKLRSRAYTVEAWNGDDLVGLVAAYVDPPFAFVTNVSVLPQAASRGVASALLAQLVEHADRTGIRTIALEVAPDAAVARRVYAKCGFVDDGTREGRAVMRRTREAG